MKLFLYVFQANPIGQCGLGAMHLYGKGVEKVRSLNLSLGSFLKSCGLIFNLLPKRISQQQDFLWPTVKELKQN